MHKVIPCDNCTTDNCFIQSYCTPEWISTISNRKTQVRYPPGQNIFREGDRVFGIFFINHGKVKVISTGLMGKEQIVRLAKDGHILGHRGYGNDNYPVGAVTLEDSLICFVDNDTLYDAFMDNPKFTFRLMMFYSQELRKVEVRTKYLTQMNVRERVAQALLMVNDVFNGQREKDGKIKLNVQLSRQDIADIAGTSREQVTRTLTVFKKDKIIKTGRKKTIILDHESLMNVVADFQREL